MILGAKHVARGALWGLLLLTACTAAKVVRKSPQNEISGWIRVFGVTKGVVLVGPAGDFDADNGRVKHNGIRGCVRDVGQEGLEPGEDEDSGDFVDFVLRGASSGRYTLWIAATRADTVTISVEKMVRETVVECGQMLEPRPLVAGRRYRVDIDIASVGVASPCGVLVGPIVEASWPGRLRSSLP